MGHTVVKQHMCHMCQNLLQSNEETKTSTVQNNLSRLFRCLGKNTNNIIHKQVRVSGKTRRMYHENMQYMHLLKPSKKPSSTLSTVPTLDSNSRHQPPVDLDELQLITHKGCNDLVTTLTQHMHKA